MNWQKGGVENSLCRTRPPRPDLAEPSQDACDFIHLRFVSRDLWIFFFSVLFSYVQKRHIFWENISLSEASWLVFRPPPLLSDGGNKAFLPESSVRWQGNGKHSNELVLQASFGSLFLYPLARGTNSKQQPNPWALRILRNSADWTIKGSPCKSGL